ncbi:MAG TPA: CPBP family intramembrane glutamic endopeptidase [Spirochaetota bacterium]|nr:CPBP family intramembrane glutamic endopeptidase [Spirochaetota bacterium]
MKKIVLLLEFSLIFIVLPLALYLLRQNLTHLVIPLLLAGFIGCMVYLVRNKYMSRDIFFRLKKFIPVLKIIIIRLLAGGTLLLLWQYFAGKDFLFYLPRHKPRLWLLIMFFYPLFSVIPQEVIYRVFIRQRYRIFFSHPAVYVLVSGAAFGLVHIFFGNLTAPLLSFAGGIIFAMTYLKTGSVLQSSLEHALWGDLIFTIGLGHYFYSG